MAGHTTTFFLLLVLLGASLADASQEDQLRKFILSKSEKRLASRARNANTPEGPDSWADASSFSHLPTRCPSPPVGAKAADKITALPGQPPRVNFDQYSGYVTVSEKYGRELFYYFVEAPYEAASKPLLLWLNGGPGCSSLGYGAMTELGPFRVNPDGKTLSGNKHAWNNLANVIFLESPAGVGFSHASNNPNNNNNVGDPRTAEDAFLFLLHWLERFPEYKGRDFYIAGESYGGHYVPQLATVIEYMNELYGGTLINLRGILVGNPYLDNYKNDEGSLEFLWNHGVISDEGWANIRENCTFTPKDDWQCFVASRKPRTGNIDLHNIYAPICLKSKRDGTYHSSGYLAGYDPCIDHYVLAYLNNGEVQQALHARANTSWTACSGDMDDVCPITATRYSVKDLNLPITKPWRPWYTPDSEVGGYVQQYKGGFTFASVRGAGHLVPSYQPKRALVLLYSFLKGVLPPADIPN
ncbi:serine carboxypeptidase 1-like [Triticum dicoccoides]|uniref:serine carboxypeptidase 1-like n=1 Tax=Triticum dicoccoides TaxID=85692 RepID=UPI00188E5C19|nr:serine carboxypeptidase 1-like [Triticum dicoccoides]XP_044393211.1 serine carboxypeptidase 1-like [Triticum aestivum]